MTSSSYSSQKKNVHSLLANNLMKLTITPPQPSSSSPLTSTPDFDFSDVFGPNHGSPSTSAPAAFIGDPPVIHNRSHSFVGPSPRYTLSASLSFKIQIREDEEEEEENDDVFELECESSCEIERYKGKSGSEELVEENEEKIGPGDFEILRVIGQGAFGKVFQVRHKKKKNSKTKEGDNHNHDGNDDGDDDDDVVSSDGIYAMKVMRKDTIIKKNHVDYMKAERDILTKVVHPFIVQLRYSFQVPPFSFFIF